MTTAPRPFELHVPDNAIDDLRERLARTRWPDSAPGPAWAYGSDVAYLQELVAFWRQRFDWRVHEARLNALPLSCAHATSNHLSVWSAMRISAQMQKNAAASSTKIGTNQAGNTPSNWGRDPNITIRPGNTR